MDPNSLKSNDQKNNEPADIKKILVTGANGYLGSWIVYYLLEKGIQVRASIRDKKQSHYDHLLEMPEALGVDPNNLEIVEGLLENKDIWPEIVNSCNAIIHCASPNPYMAPGDDLELIFPAVEGSLAICKAAIDCGIKKVVYTSSLGVIGGSSYRRLYTENNSSIKDFDKLSSYEKSKQLAYKSVICYNKEYMDVVKQTFICPGFLIGPTKQKYCTSSNCLFFKHIFSDEMKSVLKTSVSFVDVRDAAKAHINAIFRSHQIGNNEKYIITNESHCLTKLCNKLETIYGKHGYIFPKNGVSKSEVKMACHYNINIKPLTVLYGKEINYATEKAKKDKVLFESEYTPFIETIKNMFEDFVKKEFISDKRIVLFEAEQQLSKEETEGGEIELKLETDTIELKLES